MFKDQTTTDIFSYLHTLSLHDALPISSPKTCGCRRTIFCVMCAATSSSVKRPASVAMSARSEEHTSELQSLTSISYAVFCLKKTKIFSTLYITHISRTFIHKHIINTLTYITCMI